MRELPSVRKKLMNHDHPEWIAVTEYIADLFDDMKQFITPDDTIIQLGCGCGYVLDALWEMGYRNLTGLDKNKGDDQNDWNPGIKFIHSEIGVLKSYIDGVTYVNDINTIPQYDVILCHRFLYIWPDEKDWLFEKIAQKVKKFLVVVEIEEKSRVIPTHRWKRNYQKIFEQFGLEQFFTESNVFPLQSAEIMATITRVFKKI